jgi:hypothetical protein
MAIGMVVAVAGIHAAAAQGISIEARTALVSAEPYVERLELTVRNATATPQGVEIRGSRRPWSNESPPFSTLFRCANLTPIEDNACLAFDPCRDDDFLPPPPICGAFSIAPVSEVRCAWRVTPRTPGCASELLRLAVIPPAGNVVQERFIPLLTRASGIPTASVPALMALAGLLLVLASAALVRRRPRAAPQS